MVTKRPWFHSKETKVTYYQGTPNQQTVTYPPVVTHAEVVIAKVAWWLSQACMVEEQCLHRGGNCNHRRKPPKYPNHYSGTGFYMSQPIAARLRWIWRGRSIYSLFWGSRTKNHVNFELRDDRIGTHW